jgi:hypothetical protein
VWMKDDCGTDSLLLFAAVRIKCNTAKFLRGVDPLTA